MIIYYRFNLNVIGGNRIKLKYEFIILVMLISLLFIGAVAASEDINVNKGNKTSDISVSTEILNSENTNSAGSLQSSGEDLNKNIDEVKNISKNKDVLTSSCDEIIKDSSSDEDLLSDIKLNNADNQNLNYSGFLASSDSDKLTAPVDSFTALKSLIDATSAGGVLNLGRNYKYYASDDSGISTWGIPLQKNIVINGGNYAIDASGAHCRVFRVYSGYTVTLNNLTIKNSRGVYNSILYSEGNGVNFNNCKFIDSDTIDGGVIYIASGLANFNNCIFNNTSTTSGSGGAIITLASTCNVYNTIFESTQSVGMGGAIYTTTGTLNVVNSSFIKCTSLGDSEGGAIHARETSKLNIDNCNFIDNTGNAGGAVYYRADSLTVKNSYFYNNYARGNNPVGGAICLSTSSTNGGTITNCTFIKNRAARNGGAILANKNINIYGSTFIDNYASSAGGAIAGDALLTMRDSILLGNDAGTSTASDKIILGSSSTTSTLNYNWWVILFLIIIV